MRGVPPRGGVREGVLLNRALAILFKTDSLAGNLTLFMPEIPVHKHQINDYLIRVVAEWDAPDFLDFLARLSDEKIFSGGKVLQEGRNRVVCVQSHCAGAAREVVVKTYGNPGFFRRLITPSKKGGKAHRAFEAALALCKNGTDTPKPIALVERREGNRLAESHFVCEYIPELSDFRRELNHELHRKCDGESLMVLIEDVARAICRLHDGGVIHRDLGNQNIGIAKNSDGSRRVLFMDLNRARIFPPKSLTDEQRGKDLSRLDIPSGIFNEFLLIYGAGKDCRKAEAKARRLFDLHAFLRPFRHPIREYRLRKIDGQALVFRGAEQRRFRRNLWVWDERSSQPVPVLASRERRWLRPVANILSSVFQLFSRGLSVRKAFGELAGASFSRPVPFSGTFGIALEESPETWDRQLKYLNEMQGALRLPVLLRVYHHKDFGHRERVVARARELHARGHSVAFAFVQDRKALLRPESWEKMLEYVIGETQDFADFYEIGHAVNRGKWGIWDFREYKKLIAPALKAKSRFPHIRLTGPACIDFDLHSLPALLGILPEGCFDTLSQHLYVDRRGAPENCQGKLDTVDKCALHRAVARTYHFREEKIIVSEVNWPLLNTGPWSPVGLLFPNSGPWESPPSVSEDNYAKFMLRYWLLTIGSGHVSRIYWWRLAARGYGLVDDTGSSENWRPRPAFYALKTWLEKLSDAHLVRRIDGLPAGEFALEFSRKDNSRFTVKWTLDSMPEVRD